MENDFLTKSAIIAILRLRARGLWVKYKEERENPTREKGFARCSRPYCHKEFSKINKCIKIINENIK